MVLIFEIAVLLLLFFIAVEIRALRSELSKLPFHLGRNEDKKESPTINVNVGTLPQGQPAREVSVEKESGEIDANSGAAETAEAPEIEEASRPVPEPRPILEPRSVMATASGLVVVKCPTCQAENSSYRSECFNCGANLR